MTTSASSGVKRPLDMIETEKSLWLVKIPTNVAEMWRSAQPGESLGSLSIESVPPSAPGKKSRNKVSINLRSDIAEDSHDVDNSHVKIPRVTEFTLDETQQMKGSSSNLVVFDSTDYQDNFSVKGHVTTTWSLTPKDTEQYRQAVKNRQLKATTKTHSVKAVDPKTVFDSANKVQEVGFKPPAYVTDRNRTIDGVGLVRRNRGEKASEKEMRELKRKLLEVFAEREFLTFKEMNGYCQAYEPDLRELVKKYCVYHTKGSLKTYYELKPEYKGKMTGK